MPPPTTAVYFNTTAPAAPPGGQNNVFQTDGGQPSQDITSYTPPATADLCGAVRPDGTTLEVDENGVMSVIAPGTGGGGGGTAASGLVLTPVKPAGAKDGSNTLFTLPAPPVAGTFGIAFLNGVQLEVLGSSAEYAVQGTQFTTKYPPQSTDRLTYYYYMGTPNSESGGGGTTVPITPGTFIQGASGVSGANPGTYSLAFPAANGAGNCLIVDVALREGFAGSSGTITVTDTQGNTYSQVESGELAGCAGIAFVAFNCAAGSNTVTVHGAGGAGDPFVFVLAIHEYVATALDSAAYAYNSVTSDFPVTASVTTTQTLDLLHIFGFAAGGALPFTDTGGWTAREAAGPDTNFGVIIGSMDAQASAAGTYSDTISAGGHAAGCA
jgi:hypothetical protein